MLRREIELVPWCLSDGYAVNRGEVAPAFSACPFTSLRPGSEPIRFNRRKIPEGSARVDAKPTFSRLMKRPWSAVAASASRRQILHIQQGPAGCRRYQRWAKLAQDRRAIAYVGKLAKNAALAMCQKQNALAFMVKMSQQCISFKYRELAKKPGAGVKKHGCGSRDMQEKEGVSDE